MITFQYTDLEDEAVAGVIKNILKRFIKEIFDDFSLVHRTLVQPSLRKYKQKLILQKQSQVCLIKTTRYWDALNCFYQQKKKQL